MKSHRINGFSLIELLVAMVIVGILAAIAIPSYNSSTIRGSRAAAQTELLDLASIQEKIYLNSNAYTTSVTADYNGMSTGGLGRTSGQTKDQKYNLAISGTAQTYTLTATPVANKTQANDGFLSISENGKKVWDGHPDW
ncbi:MAG: type IV pilin protein [Sideroxydans sp.]|nr:type IV pilin protein [Sideroxydans sp.]